MATLVSRVNVSFLTPSGRTNFSAREGWFMATVLRSCAGASDCCEFPDFVPLPSLLSLFARFLLNHEFICESVIQEAGLLLTLAVDVTVCMLRY